MFNLPQYIVKVTSGNILLNKWSLVDIFVDHFLFPSDVFDFLFCVDIYDIVQISRFDLFDVFLEIGFCFIFFLRIKYNNMAKKYIVNWRIAIVPFEYQALVLFVVNLQELWFAHLIIIMGQVTISSRKIHTGPLFFHRNFCFGKGCIVSCPPELFFKKIVWISSSFFWIKIFPYNTQLKNNSSWSNIQGKEWGIDNVKAKAILNVF